ncbi:hypothetical protein [Brachybacterium sp. YJGR34]|uniref:hypothetical protein n=1 Tax=Brachybacterium sp. YJGR34 TaxID=2059911 RepID=UPI000E0B3436|nr:hypothetical protein [Brachybacterium sp. YJGR34]
MDRDSLIKYINATIASGDAQTSAEGYDVDAIADDLTEHVGDSRVIEIDAPVFWATVSRHQKHT